MLAITGGFSDDTEARMRIHPQRPAVALVSLVLPTGGCLFRPGKCLSRVCGRGLQTCGCDLLSVYGIRRTDFRICSPAARICRGETASRNRFCAFREPAGAIRDAENAFRRSGGAIRHPGNTIGHRKDTIRGPENGFRDSEDVTYSFGSAIRCQDFDACRAKDAIGRACTRFTKPWERIVDAGLNFTGLYGRKTRQAPSRSVSM